jgi:hypothetical protein
LFGSVCSSTQVPHIEPVHEHVPEPELQSGVGCAHAEPLFTQPPIALQVMGCAPLQPSAWYTHDPVQPPETQVWSTQAAGLPHCPEELHV